MKKSLIMLFLEEGLASTKTLKQKRASQQKRSFKEAHVAVVA